LIGLRQKGFARDEKPSEKRTCGIGDGVLHMLHSLDDSTGRMAVVLPHGVLFRGASEGRIRQQIIENFNLLDAVIGLPANLFYGTSIPACILIFKKNRTLREVLFIDASGDENYEKAKNQSVLRQRDIDKIVKTYENYETIEKFSYVATFEEIKENDFNLNIPRYVDTFEEEAAIDISANLKELAALEPEIEKLEGEMAKYLKELDIK